MEASASVVNHRATAADERHSYEREVGARSLARREAVVPALSSAHCLFSVLRIVR
jgi:hypothetical protein